MAGACSGGGDWESGTSGATGKAGMASTSGRYAGDTTGMPVGCSGALGFLPAVATRDRRAVFPRCDACDVCVVCAACVTCAACSDFTPGRAALSSFFA